MGHSQELRLIEKVRIVSSQGLPGELREHGNWGFKT